MKFIKTTFGRRSFLKSTIVTGGGVMLEFNLLASCQSEPEQIQIPDEWFEMNAYLQIGENGVVSIMSPNPEAGQNVKTSMPMIVAEELDVDWEKVIVEQAPLNTELYTRQFIGGSKAIRRGWGILRTAGATARQMLRDGCSKNVASTSGGNNHHRRYAVS